LKLEDKVVFSWEVESRDLRRFGARSLPPSEIGYCDGLAVLT
jgi:hypothetical protein